MKSLATWCVRHRVIVLVLWVAAIVSATMASNLVGTAYENSFTLPTTESSQASDLLKAAAPHISGDVEKVVFEVPAGQSVVSTENAAKIQATVDKLNAFPGVGSVVSPLSRAGAAQVSADKTVAYIDVTFGSSESDASTQRAKAFVGQATSQKGPNLTVAVAGSLAQKTNPQSLGGVWLGIVLAGVVLLLVFGSIFAMALPLVSALASLGTAVGVIGLLSHLLTIPTVSDQLVLLIGLGVGVDYALFIVSRHRQGLIAGRDVESSIVTAVDTSGRAVLFAGIIVCVALLGMFALNVGFLFGMAVAAAIGVAFTMIAALTLLPALLGFIGPKVLSRRQKKKLANEGPRIVGLGKVGFWPKWADFMRRHPLIPALVALLVVAILALPFIGIRLGSADLGNDPPSTTTRQAFDTLAKGFGPGFNGPLQLVAKTNSPEQQAAVEKAITKAADVPGVASVGAPTVIPMKGGSSVVLVSVEPTTSPQAAETSALINTLRSTTLPAALHGTNIKVMVGGATAGMVDFADTLASKLPLFIGIVLLFSFLLMTMVFRSLVIPLTAAVMNLLSIAAAFGVMTAVFQHGIFGSFFGVSRTGPIEAFIPVMMFAILFGLSMDYEVFLLTRIHEEWLRTKDNSLAVRNGLAATGKTITAAGLIMILVFASFILGGQLVIKEFGVGLAAGIMVDAVFVRMALVPSVMQMLGRSNWWFPRWLDRILPRISVEPDDEAMELGGKNQEFVVAE